MSTWLPTGCLSFGPIANCTRTELLRGRPSAYRTCCDQTLVSRLARQQRLGIQRLRPVLVAHRISGSVHRDTCRFAFGVEHVKVDAEVGGAVWFEQALFYSVGFDSFEHFHPGVFGMRAAAHLFDDHKRAEVIKISLAATG